MSAMKIAIGVAVLAAVGGGIYYFTRNSEVQPMREVDPSPALQGNSGDTRTLVTNVVNQAASQVIAASFIDPFDTWLSSQRDPRVRSYVAGLPAEQRAWLRSLDPSPRDEAIRRALNGHGEVPGSFSDASGAVASGQPVGSLT